MGINTQSLVILDDREIIYSVSSNVDDLGRVFFYKGRVFRAIRNEAKDYCLDLLDSALFKELISNELIPETRVAAFKLKDHDLVLEHEFVQPSKPHHWSFSMLRDAALMVLKLNNICIKHGYEIKDAHPYNVFFKINRPVFIDLGSVVKKSQPSRWERYVYAEFVSSFYLQLRLWSQSEIFFARRLLEDGIHPGKRTIPNSELLNSSLVKSYFKGVFNYGLFWRRKLIFETPIKVPGILVFQKFINKLVGLSLKREASPVEYLSIPKSIELAEKRIKKLKRPLERSFWENYHHLNKSVSSTSSRFDRIIKIIQKETPDVKSVVDLAGNQGAFCFQIAKDLKIERIILTDYDENAIDKAYLFCREENSIIQPYLLNFMFLMRMEETNLFKADIAIALAITHHLVLTQGYSLSAIFEMIANFSNKYVLVEFMPLGLWSVGSVPKLPEWYHVEWFREEFNKHFRPLSEENIEKNRIVFLGERY